MTRIHFHQQLAALKDKLLEMAMTTEQELETAVEAYVKRDEHLVAKVNELEMRVNRSEREVYEMAYELLAKEQPMAIDLRFILAVIKINSDLERVGDLAINISERAVAPPDTPEVSLPVDIHIMGERARIMVGLAIQSLLEEDAALAERVIRMDEEIDAMNRQTQESLMLLMESNTDVTMPALFALIVSRSLERVGDHATNIAEDVIFWVRGSDVRHRAILADAE